MHNTESLLKQAHAPLGEKSNYVDRYDSSQLCPIPRHQIYSGECYRWDDWTGYEISWLNPKGKPLVRVGLFRVPGCSPSIIESKSFKLYLNSFNGSRFETESEVVDLMTKDLSAAAGAPVQVRLLKVADAPAVLGLPGACIDDLDVEILHYAPEASLLSTASGQEVVEERLYSDLLKSNCPVTSQPDWGSVVIDYRGTPIHHEGLLAYIVSYRDHGDFHEQCVEQIFTDIMEQCRPERLTVYARYVRRGGLDINPWRSTEPGEPDDIRLSRQ
ncbi:NADPH-dependent 7-cyano-7-deazaguanine reductase QueF [Pokkaliibacter sp. CJK22405]|uniref:NADPH-dependent 7-cyano-7-deazaguanine reductase QueF n=1 Tax=Pokkaliibacter sp. CJK22405 TaxID=3384615 RepID=UPI0039854B6E